MADGVEGQGATARARQAASLAGRVLLAIGRMLMAALAFSWPYVRKLLRAIGTALLALVLIFEEWGWRPLADLLALLARFRLWARAEGWIAGLPPYGALAVFVLPSTLLFPVKLLALMLLAKGQVLLAGAMIAGAKVAGTAVVARIFMLTKPALMRLAWFARAYGIFIPWKEALFERVRASWAWRYGRVVKAMLKREARRTWVALKPRLLAAAVVWRVRARMAWSRLRAEIAALAGKGSRIG